MSAKLGTRTEALKSISELLHEYREDCLAMARYHNGPWASTRGATNNTHLQTSKIACKQQETISFHTIYWWCSPEQSESVSLFHSHFSQAVLKTSSQLSLRSIPFKQSCHHFFISSHLCPQFYHILLPGCHPNLSHKAFLFPCLPQLP